VDSGANVHIVHDQSLLHDPVIYRPPRPLNLATSDASGGIVARGDVCLISPNGIPFGSIMYNVYQLLQPICCQCQLPLQMVCVW
jgi:hypothetical protein